jgi:hypothetical protein
MKLNRKNKLLIGCFFLVLFLCYNLAIKKTIYYYSQYNSQKELLNNINNSPRVLANLLARDKQINQWLSKNDIMSSSFQSELLKQLNEYCSSHNLKITDFKEPHVIIEKQTEISSYFFSVEGNFNYTLGLINKIENNPNLGLIKHLTTEKKMNYKTNEEFIVTNVIIQKSSLKK